VALDYLLPATSAPPSDAPRVAPPGTTARCIGPWPRLPTAGQAEPSDAQGHLSLLPNTVIWGRLRRPRGVTGHRGLRLRPRRRAAMRRRKVGRRSWGGTKGGGWRGKAQGNFYRLNLRYPVLQNDAVECQAYLTVRDKGLVLILSF
jgi:hypothetical protein